MNLKTLRFLAAAVFTVTAVSHSAQDTRFSARQVVELDIPTQAGSGYRILESDALGEWRQVGLQFMGNGGVIRQRVDAARPAHFFRVESFEVRNLGPILEEIRARRGVPGLACAVVLADRVVGVGAAGIRKIGTSVPVTVGDKWHIGSLTKSMTATLAAMLVEEGRIRWADTLADIFPELAPSMNSGWRTATLEQLTSNRGGAPNSVANTLWTEFGGFYGTPREARRFMMQRLTTVAPSATPGSRYEYSNYGFAIAGHMLETVAGKAWEELINERLFAPLGMTGVGYAAAGAPRHIDQPLGHYLANATLPPSAANPITPVEPGVYADNPPAIGPAGTLHCTIMDMAFYVAFHLRAHREDTPLLSNESALKLHRAYANNNNYAHGWSVNYRSWAQGDALSHTGSNTKWYANVWLAPNRGFAVVTFSNLGGDAAFGATDDVSARMIQEFLNR